MVHVRAFLGERLLLLVATLSISACSRYDDKLPAPSKPGAEADLDAGSSADSGHADSSMQEEDGGFGAGAVMDAQPVSPIECDVTAPTACPSPAPRYADVQPIFAERCIGCHNGSDGRWPLSAYQHVADWYAEIRGQMLNCSMPPVDSGISMTRQERESILVWIRCGFPR